MEPTIVDLPAGRFARFHALSSSPELEALSRLKGWAEPRGLLAGTSDSRVYGFNNPDPSVGSPNYGYEFWISVESVPEDTLGEVELVSFEGGRYATVPFEDSDPYKLPEAWRSLVEWAEGAGHALGSHQWLEGHSRAGMPERLFLPITA